MRNISYTFWQEEKWFLGFLNAYPDYCTQAQSKAELIENLQDLLADIESEEIPYIRKVEEMVVA